VNVTIGSSPSQQKGQHATYYQSPLTTCLNAVDRFYIQQMSNADAFINTSFTKQASSLLAAELKGAFQGALGGVLGYNVSALGIIDTLAGLGTPTAWSEYLPLLSGDTAATVITGATWGALGGALGTAAWLVAQNLDAQAIAIAGVNAALAQMERSQEQVCRTQINGH